MQFMQMILQMCKICTWNFADGSAQPPPGLRISAWTPDTITPSQCQVVTETGQPPPALATSQPAALRPARGSASGHAAQSKSNSASQGQLPDPQLPQLKTSSY